MTCLQAHVGVLLHFYPSTSKPVNVRIGTTSAQDLTCDLGAPLRVFYKEDDRMAIHSRNKTPDGTEDGCQLFSAHLQLDKLLMKAQTSTTTSSMASTS